MTTALAIAPTTDEYGLANLTIEQRVERKDELISKWARSLKDQAEVLCELAATVRSLEEDGHPLEDMSPAFKNLLRMIAHKQVMPEIIAALWNTAHTLERVISLPLPDQQNVVDLVKNGKGILVASLVPGEGRRVPVNALSRKEALQVFDTQARAIRNENEQLAYLKSKVKEPRKATAPITIGRDRQSIVVSEPSTITRQELLRLLTLMG